MHSLVRRYIKTAILFLAAGLAIGVHMLALRELQGRFPSPFETSAHAHAILAGFVMTLILGVALWLFPRPAGSDARYDPRLAAAAWWLLTTGNVARVGGELLRVSSTAPWLRWTVFLGGVAQTLALLVFFWTMWSRIRGTGSVEREKKGEKF